ncbi:MAG TPA: hypothetical protein PKX87_09150 [Alphaproteobacteria bacterium]|nr:hypothetical protein [Alphaproteobacteria bacterium]
MANHANSVFGSGATHLTPGATTRLYAAGAGADGPSYFLLTDTLTITTTDVAATASIDAVAADMGIDHLIWAPSANTHASGTFKTPRMSKMTVDLAGGNVVSPGHAIASFAQSVYKGAGTAALGFGIESKLIVEDAGTTLSSFSHFKPAIGDIDGAVGVHIAFDADVDFAGISGTVTDKYALYAPRTDALSVVKGGLELAAKFLVGDYTLTRGDAENKLMSFGSGAITLTVPSTLPAGFGVTVMQGLTGDTITFAASGGNSVFNKDSHTKTGGQFAACRIDLISSGGSGAGILSGATGA